ncbi:ABC transporter ATP-binding protein [Anaerobacillus sp. MEB173]|uniref:ABC transporter ATP-binding protein n=1 Tax=Anaerobacillus sp. MEB173 TaxID=3383345 RepID=UPI003F924FFF
MIEISGLTKTFQKKKVLDDVHLVVERNECCALVGRNGAGKSTLIHAMLSILPVNSGTVKLNGVVNTKNNWKKSVAYLPEKFQLYPHLTGMENIQFFAELGEKKVNEKRIEEMLGKVSLWDDRNHQVKGYSKGMLQRLGLAIMLYYDTEILILDEPTSGLDPMGREEVLAILKSLTDKTVFLSSHHMDEIKQICSHVAFLENGKITKYTVDDFTKKLTLGGSY